MGIEIKGVGKYAPVFTVPNEAFSKIVETNDEWISTRTGIKSRHLSDGESTYEMGTIAARQAIENAKIDVQAIDLVLVSSVTPDFASPSVSCLIAAELELTGIPCIDINCACAGFVYALDAAQKYLCSGEYKTVLVVATEMLSRITDYTDRSTCVLFGDGAGACILTQSEKLYASCIGTETEGVRKIFAKGMPLNNPFTPTVQWNGEAEFDHGNGRYLYMDGREVYKFATRILPYSIEKACEKAGISKEDLALIIPHQANIRIMQTAAKNLGLPMERFFVDVDEYGNTSSASVAMGIADAHAHGLLKRGDKIALTGFGAGLTYAAIVLEW